MRAPVFGEELVVGNTYGNTLKKGMREKILVLIKSGYDPFRVEMKGYMLGYSNVSCICFMDPADWSGECLNEKHSHLIERSDAKGSCRIATKRSLGSWIDFWGKLERSWVLFSWKKFRK